MRAVRIGRRCAVSRSSSSRIPSWPDNVRVDVRDPRWQEILLREEVPRLMQLGFDGLMLDTIDTAPYLENKDPARFAGSRQALRDWLRRLRESFPRAVVIANGGAALVDAAPFVDGFVIEGVFSIYDPGRQGLPGHDRRRTDLEAGRDRARARRSRASPCSRSNTPTSATSRCHDGPSRNRSATASAPTSGSAISTPRPNVSLAYFNSF